MTDVERQIFDAALLAGRLWRDPSDTGNGDTGNALDALAEAVKRYDENLRHGAPERPCTCCMFFAEQRVPATYIATDADGMQWFECGRHDAHENVAQTVRVSLTPIGDWFRQLGIGE